MRNFNFDRLLYLISIWKTGCRDGGLSPWTKEKFPGMLQYNPWLLYIKVSSKMTFTYYTLIKTILLHQLFFLF